MQTLAVILLIGLAGYFVVRRFLALLRGGSPCGCCAESDKCGEKQPDKGTPLEDHRKNTS